jgi:hypothetical protein
MLKELPKEGLVNLMYIFNAILRLEYWPESVNIAQIMEKSNGRFILPTSQLTPYNLKSSRKVYTKKNQ